jgi:hypothetical protein
MVYQNHRLKMVIQWKMWMATEIHLDHSSPLRKKWSPLHQVTLGYEDTSAKYEAWCDTFLVEEFFMLSLLKVFMNLLLEGWIYSTNIVSQSTQVWMESFNEDTA